MCVSLLVSMATVGTFLCDQTLGDCENLKEFLGSSQVTYPKINDESYCDSLLLNFSDTVSCCQYYDEIPQFEFGPKNNPPFLYHTLILDHSKKILKIFMKLFATFHLSRILFVFLKLAFKLPP